MANFNYFAQLFIFAHCSFAYFQMTEKDQDRSFQLECIEVYKNLPSLWKVKSDDYSNRRKKDAAYAVLVEKFNEKFPNFTREDVKKKINGYRTNFRKELKKVMDSEKSGAGTEEIYQPTLWYFDALAFLNDQEIPAKSRSTLDSGNSEEEVSTKNRHLIFFIHIIGTFVVLHIIKKK